MARLLRMPEIAANTLEATLSEWLLSENTAFADGDVIATVETDKAAVDVAADGAGVMVRTLVGPGATVAVGAPMALLAEPDEVIDDVGAVLERLGGSDGVAGAEPVALDDPATPVELDGQTPPTAVVGPAGGTAPVGRVMASPLGRRLARDSGLVIEDLTGSGPGGRIVRDDVRRAVAARPGTPGGPPAPAAPATGPPALAAPRTDAAGNGSPAPSVSRVGRRPAGEYEDIPHSRMRRAIAARLAESNREAPHFAIRGSARVDELLAMRATLNAGSGPRISVTDLVVTAAARTHAAVPEMNVIWTPDAVRAFRSVDVAVAVATDRGLVTPVLRGVEDLTVSAVARAGADLVQRARAGTLRQDELEGGSLTVTNLGGFGTEDFTAVINPPQSAILAVGAARQEAVVTDGELGVATVLRVTLSVDHRPIDGALAARWMATFLALVEEPLRIVA